MRVATVILRDCLREPRLILSTLYAPAWPKMRAFALPSFYDGQIQINLSGHEGEGIVAIDDYEHELDRIEAELNGMRDLKTDGKVVAFLWLRCSKLI